MKCISPRQILRDTVSMARVMVFAIEATTQIPESEVYLLA